MRIYKGPINYSLLGELYMIRPIVLANECFRVYLVGEVEKW